VYYKSWNKKKREYEPPLHSSALDAVQSSVELIVPAYSENKWIKQQNHLKINFLSSCCSWKEAFGQKGEMCSEVVKLAACIFSWLGTKVCKFPILADQLPIEHKYCITPSYTTTNWTEVVHYVCAVLHPVQFNLLDY
jgi:hypothetical protein